MPCDAFTIRRVTPYDTRKGATLYVVKGSTVAGRPMTLKTLNALHALACDRAAELNVKIRITWKDGRPQPFASDHQADIITCELPEHV